jgi:hypothetical protein
MITMEAIHMTDCAIREDGPCTCGTEEVLEELALEEANLEEEHGY